MTLRKDLVDALLSKLKKDFPKSDFSIEKGCQNNFDGNIVEDISGKKYVNGKSESALIKCNTANSVGIIITWNNESENAFIVFIGYELGFIPYKMEIITQKSESYIVKKSNAANDRLQEYNTPIEEHFYNEDDLINYLTVPISKWLDCRKY